MNALLVLTFLVGAFIGARLGKWIGYCAAVEEVGRREYFLLINRARARARERVSNRF